MEFGIEKCAIILVKSGKKEHRKEYNGQIRKHQKAFGEKPLQVLRNNGSGHNQMNIDEK